MDETYLYPYSAEEARRRNETALWRASHNANMACKKAVEEAIRQGFDGLHLNEGCLQSVLKEFGYKRLNWVLANTLREKYLRKNQAWASQTSIPGHIRNFEFVVDSPPAGLDDFVASFRKAYRKLGLFGGEHCEPRSRSDLNYEGRVLVLSPDILKESCWTPKNQLWYAQGGFGCAPHSRGSAVFCTCLGDGEETRWDRADFVGVLKEELLPDWAAPKLAELRGQRQSGMDGMQMK